MEIKGAAQNAEGKIRHGTMSSPYQIPLKKNKKRSIPKMNSL